MNAQKPDLGPASQPRTRKRGTRQRRAPSLEGKGHQGAGMGRNRGSPSGVSLTPLQAALSPAPAASSRCARYRE